MTNDLSIWHTAASSLFYIFFSFKSYAHIQTLTLSRIYQHYMFLHHSQTGPYLVKLQVYLAPIILKPTDRCSLSRLCLNTMHFYIILKRHVCDVPGHHCLNTIRFYIILKRCAITPDSCCSLNTIRFYIILKPFQSVILFLGCLNTIRFYIILKPSISVSCENLCLNTIRFYIILKPTGALLILAIVWIPYVFTSFSNEGWK